MKKTLKHYPILILLLNGFLVSCSETNSKTVIATKSIEKETPLLVEDTIKNRISTDLIHLELIYLTENDSLIDLLCASDQRYTDCYGDVLANSYTDKDEGELIAMEVYKLVFTEYDLNYWCKLELINRVNRSPEIAWPLEAHLCYDIKTGNTSFLNKNLLPVLSAGYENFSNVPKLWTDYLEAHPFESNTDIIPL